MDRPGAHGVNSLSGLRGYGGQLPTNNESRRAGKQRATRNGEFVLRVRWVYAMASWIGESISLMVPVTAELESQGSGP